MDGVTSPEDVTPLPNKEVYKMTTLLPSTLFLFVLASEVMISIHTDSRVQQFDILRNICPLFKMVKNIPERVGM